MESKADVPAREVGNMVKSIHNLIMRNAVRRECMQEGDRLSPMQSFLMEYLYYQRDRDLFQKDMEKEFSLPKSTLASILKQLELKGYITREEAEDDNRKKRIRLSEEGLHLQKKRCNNLLRINELMCHGISAEEIETFLRIGEKFRENLEHQISGKRNRKENPAGKEKAYD